MAFEDRSSPNTATSPSCSENSLNSFNSPNSPESTRTSPYTCTTIPHPNETSRSFTPLSSPPSSTSPITNPKCPKPDPERSFFRITSYALSSPPYDYNNRTSPKTPLSKPTPPPPPPPPKTSVESNPNLFLRDCPLRPPSSPDEEEPSIQHLKYSIRNILQPDFGRSALVKTKSAVEISFKPYESSGDAAAPLGSLTQAVNQIGKSHLREAAPVRPARLKSPATTESCLGSPEEVGKSEDSKLPTLWPAWVYCTRYSDRPSSGPRSRRIKKLPKAVAEEKRPRTAFSGAQLARLKHEFAENRYLTEKRRQQLSQELGLNEAQIKIWFQNKRAKIKKSSGQKNALAIQLMAQE